MRRLVAAVLSVLLAGACSSTIDKGPATASSAPDDAPASSTRRPAKPATDASGTPVDGIAHGFGSSRPTARTAVAAPGRARAARIPGGGNGVTDSTVKIGVTWTDIKGGFGEIASATGSDFGNYTGGSDMRSNAKAVIDDLNAQGGIGGRKIEPVWYEYAFTSYFTPQSRASAEQSECAAFTDDTKVFAMITVGSAAGVIVDCAKRRDTPVITTSNGEEGIDQKRFSEIGNWWYAPGWVTVERRDRAYVAGLVRQRFLPKDAVAGLMVWDRPSAKRSLNNTLKPALARAGIKIAKEVAFAESESDFSSHVLQMKAAGVTHILWSYAATAGRPGTFMQNSESQAYRPKHFLSTEPWLDLVTTQAPAAQLAGAKGVGWTPAYDLAPDPARKPINAGDKRCRALHARRNITRAGGLELYCSSFFLVQAALGRAPSMTATGLRRGVESLGTSVSLPDVHVARFAPGVHDGAAVVRDLAYKGDCNCFVYTGPPKDAP